jgi:hypothetical protein
MKMLVALEGPQRTPYPLKDSQFVLHGHEQADSS